MSPRHLPQAPGQLVGRLALDTALAAGAALRITRFATTDVLGGWVLADPAKRWADRNEPGQPFGYAAPPSAWRHRLVSALDCPYCVGTQATLAAALILAVLHPHTRPGRLARTACAALAASYAVGHTSYRLDSQPQAQPSSAAPSQKDTK